MDLCVLGLPLPNIMDDIELKKKTKATISSPIIFHSMLWFEGFRKLNVFSIYLSCLIIYNSQKRVGWLFQDTLYKERFQAQTIHIKSFRKTGAKKYEESDEKYLERNVNNRNEIKLLKIENCARPSAYT